MTKETPGALFPGQVNIGLVRLAQIGIGLPALAWLGLAGPSQGLLHPPPIQLAVAFQRGFQLFECQPGLFGLGVQVAYLWRG